MLFTTCGCPSRSYYFRKLDTLMPIFPWIDIHLNRDTPMYRAGPRAWKGSDCQRRNTYWMGGPNERRSATFYIFIKLNMYSKVICRHQLLLIGYNYYYWCKWYSKLSPGRIFSVAIFISYYFTIGTRLNKYSL